MDMPERIAKLEAQVESIKEDVSELKGDVKEVHSRITTGNREILEKIDSMECRLEERMKAGAAASKEQHEDIQKALQIDIKEVTNRVGVLERWRWTIIGGAIVLGYIVGHLEIFSQIFGIK